MVATVRRNFWTPPFRVLIFALAATSILCLLTEFYRLCPMRAFALFVFFPATFLLFAFAVFDRFRGDGQLWRGVMIGAIAGFIAAVAYDVFRLPFVFARDFGIENIVPPMDLFKVFPRFGAMILGQAIEQDSFSPAAHLIGWAYHFSNGITFGVMYLAMIGHAARRSWTWAVLMAVGVEIAMLLTPYPSVFGIAVSVTFVLVTLTAHLIFGVGMGLTSRRLSLAGSRVA